MSFFSPCFILFFLLILVIYYLVPSEYRFFLILFASLGFYYQCDTKSFLYLLLFIGSTYLCGRYLEFIKNESLKRVLMGLCVIIWSISFWSMKSTWGANSIYMPVGFAFWGIQGIGYLFDVYYDRTKAEKSILKYALFISFFPIVTSGPIERSNNLLQQLNKESTFEYSNIRDGLLLLTWGFYQKIVIADNIAPLVDNIFSNYQNYRGIYVVVGVVLYSIQLYADFAGYSNIACGMAQCFGFSVIQNFKQPYFATSVKEFWHRWHISFSTWLKDYVYIPLGGSRCGKLRTYSNIMITFLFSGLWHGIAGNYVIWGLLHGSYQVCENVFRYRHRDRFRALKMFYVYISVSFGWLFFRAESLPDAFAMIRHSVNCNEMLGNGITYRNLGEILILTLPMVAVDILHEKNIQVRNIMQKQTILIRWTSYLAIGMFLLIIWLRHYGVQAATFLYTRF